MLGVGFSSGVAVVFRLAGGRQEDDLGRFDGVLPRKGELQLEDFALIKRSLGAAHRHDPSLVHRALHLDRKQASRLHVLQLSLEALRAPADNLRRRAPTRHHAARSARAPRAVLPRLSTRRLARALCSSAATLPPPPQPAFVHTPISPTLTAYTFHPQLFFDNSIFR